MLGERAEEDENVTNGFQEHFAVGSLLELRVQS